MESRNETKKMSLYLDKFSKVSNNCDVIGCDLLFQDKIDNHAEIDDVGLADLLPLCSELCCL